MIIYNKNVVNKRKPTITSPILKVRGRLSTTKRITIGNKKFLRALGFKI